MSSQLEDLMEERAIRRKLGVSFTHAHLSPILEYAHNLRENDHIRFDEALNIAAGKARRPYGSPKL